jgi:hypothetical protein
MDEVEEQHCNKREDMERRYLEILSQGKSTENDRNEKERERYDEIRAISKLFGVVVGSIVEDYRPSKSLYMKEHNLPPSGSGSWLIASG